MPGKRAKVINRISTGEMADRIGKSRRQVQSVCREELTLDRDSTIDDWLERNNIDYSSIVYWSRGQRQIREDVEALFLMVIERRERRRAGKE